MAFRLGDLVIAGFFYNSRPFSVHGRLLLRGCEMPVLVELTGDPAEDLRGRGFEFEVPRNDRPPTDEDRERAMAFRNQQIGPVGEMTASQKRKTFDCSVEEFYRRSELGEPPPVRWCQCLYLEWFSQNGRVVIELADPQLRFLENGQAPSGTDEFPRETEDSQTEATPDDASPDSEDEIPPFASSPGAEDESTNADDEGYGLIPEEFNRELERSARRIDREIAAKPPGADGGIEECEMLDDLIEHGEATPTGKLLDRLRLPAPSADLTETQARQALNTALMELALFGIAFHICGHCSIQDAYRILIEKVCEECRVFPEMRGTSFVQHFSTSDFCQQCQDEPFE
jgi:hypothetical protein